jgi:hypothetical protein
MVKYTKSKLPSAPKRLKKEQFANEQEFLDACDTGIEDEPEDDLSDEPTRSRRSKATTQGPEASREVREVHEALSLEEADKGWDIIHKINDKTITIDQLKTEYKNNPNIVKFAIFNAAKSGEYGMNNDEKTTTTTDRIQSAKYKRHIEDIAKQLGIKHELVLEAESWAW